MKLVNHSDFNDELILQMIRFICRRLPVGCKVTIKRHGGWGKGLGGGAFRSAFDGRGQRRSRPVSRGGSVQVWTPHASNDRKHLINPGHGGYLPREYFGALERFFAVLAHEIRHVEQGWKPYARGVRKIRRHRLGTCGKLCEVDATLYEIRALRRFRREWPRPSPAVLPLP